MPNIQRTKCEDCLNNIYSGESLTFYCSMQRLEYKSEEAEKCDWFDDDGERPLRIPCYECVNNVGSSCVEGVGGYKTRRVKHCTKFTKTNVVGFLPSPEPQEKVEAKEKKPKVKFVTNNEISVFMYTD